MGELSPSDVVALSGNGNNGDGWGGNGNGWWIILLFMIFGWGGNRGGWGNQGGGNGGGYVGGDVLYPWLNQSNQISDGFANAATQLCNCCADMQMSMLNGFNQAQLGMLNGFNAIEQGANARQMASMQQAFNAQMATMQGFNGVQSQLADCCCENRLATANQTATILAEHCADRAALSDGVRDIIAAQTAGTQRIIDQLCQDKIDAKNDEIAQLRQQLNMQALAASQQAQNTFIAQGFANEVDQLYERLNNCPVPSMPVYGRTPIFTCQNQNSGCGCGCGFAA